MSPVTYAPSPSCALREGDFVLLLLSRVELRAAFCGQRGLQSVATKHHGAFLGLNQYLCIWGVITGPYIALSMTPKQPLVPCTELTSSTGQNH